MATSARKTSSRLCRDPWGGASVIPRGAPEPRVWLQRLLLPALLLLTSCVAEPAPEFSEDPSLTCPATMLLITGGEFLLGEGEDAEFTPPEPGAVIYEANFDIASFCVDPLPFPGRAGAPWPSAGLSAARAEGLDSRLATFGRRLCTISELLLASAGPENWRYPYDPEDWSEGLCDPDDLTPDPLGSYEDCTSPLGVSDFQVRSTWG